jgi:DNA-binding CsgD family transcriptional regulator
MPLSLNSLEEVIGVSADLAAKRLSELTPRENEVANLLADGLEPREIAAKLGISPTTVDVHRGKVKMKLGVKTTVNLVKYVIVKRLADAIERDSRR